MWRKAGRGLLGRLIIFAQLYNVMFVGLNKHRNKITYLFNPRGQTLIFKEKILMKKYVSIGTYKILITFLKSS